MSKGRLPTVLLKPYRLSIAAVALLALAAALLEGVQLALFFPVFHTLLQGPLEGSLGWLSRLVDLLPGDPFQSAVLLLLAATVLKFGVFLLRDWKLARTSGAVQLGLKRDLLRLYADSGYLFFLDQKHGQLIYNVTTAANKVGTLVQKAAQLTAEIVRVLAIGALLVVAAPAPTLALAVMAGGYLLVTRWIARKVSYHTGRGRVVAGAEQTSTLNEFLEGIRQIMTFGAQEAWLKRFDTHSRRFNDLYVKDSVWLAIPRSTLDLFVVGSLFGGLWLIRELHPGWLAGHLPEMAFFAMAFLRLFPSLTQIGHLRMEVAGLAGEAEAVQGALSRPALRPLGGGGRLDGFQEGIELQGVGYSYPGRGKVLEGLELVFSKGTITAILGPSGGGKSTLACLLLGLLEPTEGRIVVDGRDLRELDLESWRRRIGFVSQDIFIFHGTVAENIAFGRKGFGAEQIRRAAEVANAREFIERLPQGYDTVVGERGMKLSGGQQQRLAIARAVLHDPEILLFDEATSFLDTESERLVQEAIDRISGDRTVILITHRLSAAQGAEEVIVLERGRIVDRGKPADRLRARSGRYYELFTAGEPATA